MRTYLLGICIMLSIASVAQRNCATDEYLSIQKNIFPSLQNKLNEVEAFINSPSPLYRTSEDVVNSINVIRIPVVVHILFNTPEQNISEAQVLSQINALNKDFRRLNADSANTPERFRSLAADVQIEFALATADPAGRPTNGIIRKFTSQPYFKTDDKIKFTSQGGSDAWDTKNYLNIWVGRFQSVIGYASVPGSPEATDGIVIATSAFGTINTAAPFHLGRTGVHEVGHWLGLKHIWGDQYCGDDAVGDTPKQGNFTPGCPSGFRTSCNNGDAGDMYMNFMDYTYDACVNLFTVGQKERMRSLFNAGGPRYNLLLSKGLSAPWNFTPVEEPQKEIKLNVYPNPVTSELNIEFDEEMTGIRLRIADMNGNIVSVFNTTSNSHKINTANLKPGLYLIMGDLNGSAIRKKFIKM